MRTSLVQNIRVAAALLAIPLTGYALDPVTPPIDSTDRAGLQITLKTSGYKFIVGQPFVVAQPTQGEHPTGILPGLWLRESFPASVTLYNRSNSEIRFRFESPEAAAQRFVFRVFNSAGDKVWESGPLAIPLSPAADAVDVTLPRRGAWRRLVQVPLRIAETPLPAGTYTLEAVIDADKQMGATALFEVVAQEPPPPPVTGIKGLVLRPTGIPLESLSPLPNEVPAGGATVQIVEVQDPFTLQPVRQWTARTDANGRFQVNVPPGEYRVTVEPMPEVRWPLGNSGGPTAALAALLVLPPTEAKTVEAKVEQGRVTELTIHLVRRGVPPPAEPRLVYLVEDVEIRPSVLAEINSAVAYAKGLVTTGGWTNPRLRPRGVTNDGIVEFDSIAVPPREAAIQVITPVEASTLFRKPDNFRGVRVFSETNNKEELVQ